MSLQADLSQGQTKACCHGSRKAEHSELQSLNPTLKFTSEGLHRGTDSKSTGPLIVSDRSQDDY
jgi:hypothetical protein